MLTNNIIPRYFKFGDYFIYAPLSFCGAVDLGH